MKRFHAMEFSMKKKTKAAVELFHENKNTTGYALNSLILFLM